MMQSNLLRNTKLQFIFIFIAFSLSINLYAAEFNSIPDSDVKRLHQDLFNASVNVRKEALIQLQWAGISDERVFDPIVEKIQSNKKISPQHAEIYIRAITCSGNPKYLKFLESLSEDKSHKKHVRKLAAKYKPELEKYQAISIAMNDQLSVDNEDFWAKRYEKGLRVSDRVRMRWAARDLYLRGLNEKSYDIAKKFLEENYKNQTDDSYAIDALSFLCKALGLSRNTQYKDILIEISNNTPNKKLAKYAERSVQYFEPAFKSNNPVLKKTNE